MDPYRNMSLKYRTDFEATRKLFGYTQRELAQKIGKTQNYLTLIETGRAKSAPVISQISQLLQVNAAFLSGDLPAHGDPIFLDDYYVFTLKTDYFQPYIFLLKCLSAYSSFIEVVYVFSDVPISANKRSGTYPRPLEGVGIKDDRGTIFFFRGQNGRKLDTLILNLTPPSQSPIIDFGGNRFFSPLVIVSSNMIERRIKASAELCKQILEGSTTRSDISKIFFRIEYWKKLAGLHSKLELR